MQGEILLRPRFKTRCDSCGKFKFIKTRFRLCMDCWEKTNGRYTGPDRSLYIDEPFDF